MIDTYWCNINGGMLLTLKQIKNLKEIDIISGYKIIGSSCQVVFNQQGQK